MNRRNFFRLIPCLACVPLIKRLCEGKKVVGPKQDIKWPMQGYGKTSKWQSGTFTTNRADVEIHYFTMNNDKWQIMDGPPKKPQFIDLTL